MVATYKEFLSRKSQHDSNSGFDPVWMPDFLFDFQQALVEWAVRKGKAAIFADCGLGKTPMQLVWAENIVRKTNKPVLILTPLAVAQQTAMEAEKFGIEAEVSRDGKFSKKIVVTNYERLHYFDSSEFSGLVCDESSAIKNFQGVRRQVVTDFVKPIRFRLFCTATAAPNDYDELGTTSEALGYLGYRDMITRFFKLEQQNGLHWARQKYRLRGHAEHPFWRWVCSFARSIRRPSDMGFSDERFVLPPLHENQITVENSTPLPGRLFSVAAKGFREERMERRNTIMERTAKVVSMLPEDRPAVIWCHYNPEGDLLEKEIKDGLQVSGSMSDEKKEERLQAFSSGQLKRLITKPKIGCWGLNWQHCSDVFTYPSHSFEQYYQLVRRCYRFGQKNPVNVNAIATEGELAVVKNLQEKALKADHMFSSLVACMRDELAIESDEFFNQEIEVPAWL